MANEKFENACTSRRTPTVEDLQFELKCVRETAHEHASINEKLHVTIDCLVDVITNSNIALRNTKHDINNCHRKLDDYHTLIVEVKRLCNEIVYGNNTRVKGGYRQLAKDILAIVNKPV